MFGLGRKKQEEPALVVIPPARPLAIAPGTNVIQLGAYEQLAKELNFRPGQLLEEQLRQHLNDLKIPTYKYGDVDAYLMHLARQEKKFWIWRPLREQDKPRGWQITGHLDEKKGDDPHGDGHGSYMDAFRYRPYDKAVPIHILRRVQKIQERFGN